MITKRISTGLATIAVAGCLMAGVGTSACEAGASAATGPNAITAAGTADSTHQPTSGMVLGRALTSSPATRVATAEKGAVRATSGHSTDRRATTTNSHWSGMVTNGKFQGAYGAWIQPRIAASTPARYSSTWVGVDGAANSDLIQTGTEADTSNGKTVYRAWEEILPAQPTESVITYTNGTPVPVAPGDSMRGEVVETATAGVWMIYLQDVTQNWYFQQNYYYSGPGASAEWIEEASEVNGTFVPPPNFGSMGFNNLEVAQNGAWYRTAMTAAYGWEMVQNGHIYATPSAPYGTPYQSFTITYHG